MSSIGFWELGLSLLAGMLTTLSPCVFPAIPMIVASASSAHRLGPLALGSGMVLSFTAIGVFISSLGLEWGVDPELFRKSAAVLVILASFFLCFPKAAAIIEGPLSKLALISDRLANKLPTHGLLGPFLLGGLLGAIWSPCSGPLLGLATGLAATAEGRWAGTLLMFVFGVGSAIPLLGFGWLSQSLGAQSFGKGVVKKGEKLKRVMGFLLLATGIFVLTGADKVLEAWVLSVLPEGWLHLITRY